MRPAAFTVSILLHVAVIGALWALAARVPGPASLRPGDGEPAPEFSFFLADSPPQNDSADEVVAVVEFTPPVQSPAVPVEIPLDPITTAPSPVAVAAPSAIESTMPAAPTKPARRSASRSSGRIAHGNGDGSGSGGGSLYQPPTYRTCPPPPYPALARTKKLEGAALLLVLVDDAGRPTKVTLKRSTGSPILDDAAVRAVWGWRFEPARSAGQAIAASVEVPIRFRYRG